MSSLPAIDATPVVIIGAGRSGTNMFRDVLTRLRGFETWPCDEINYIWRHGNRSAPTDEFRAEQAEPEVQRYIRGRFQQLVARSALLHEPSSRRFLIEKTCANSLRVPFVRAVLPEAKFIYLVRDGRDVVLSARARWKAPLDVGYLAAKARYVPVSDLPYYALRYLYNRIRKALSHRKSLAFWGPRFAGMQEIVRNHSLEYLCAYQWARCVESSDAALAELPAGQVYALRYEDFIADPDAQLTAALRFLGVETTASERRDALHDIRSTSVRREWEVLGDEHADALEIMRPALGEHGYLDPEVQDSSFQRHLSRPVRLRGGAH